MGSGFGPTGVLKVTGAGIGAWPINPPTPGEYLTLRALLTFVPSITNIYVDVSPTPMSTLFTYSIFP